MILLTSCGEEKVFYVKDIHLSKEYQQYIVSLNYYNFETENYNYCTREYTFNDIDKIATILSAADNYDFRLCDNIYLEDTLLNEVNDIFILCLKLNLPVTANILICDDVQVQNTDINSYIYNFSFFNSELKGHIPVIDNAGNVIGSYIINGEKTEYIDNKKLNIADIISNNRTDLKFYNDDYYVELKNIGTAFDIKNSVLYININLILQKYNGAGNNATHKNNITDVIRNDLITEVNQLYENKNLCDVFNMDWYKKQKGEKWDTIKIKVNIY